MGEEQPEHGCVRGIGPSLELVLQPRQQVETGLLGVPDRGLGVLVSMALDPLAEVRRIGNGKAHRRNAMPSRFPVIDARCGRKAPR